MTRRPSRSDRLAPVLAGALALLLGVLILPSVLRPPQDQPQTSTAFSPDAPEDPNAPSVFSSFNAARSGTNAGVVGEVTTTTTPARKVASACPYGFGNPPRQIESVYAPPCAAAFTGDNGGNTSYGITADAINVCFLAELTGTVSSDGEMAGPVAPNDSANMRTYKVLRDYFNSRYQLYGRRLRFFYPTNDSSQSGDAQSRARADKAKDVDKCFAALQETKPAESDQLAKRGVIHFTQAQTPEKWFGDHDPYIWSFTPSGSQDIRLGAEYYCKKLAHKPPKFTDDPRFTASRDRKVGAIVYTLPAYDNPGPTIKARLKECGVDLDPIVTYDIGATQSGTQGLASAITTMQSANVSTIFYLGDLISAVAFTQNAKLNNYFPEWFIPGFGGVDTGHIAREYDQDAWQHAFGFSLYEIPKPDTETECYKAYHEIDPANDPDNGMCTYLWDDMVQLFGSMQQAGPKLTVEAMKKAMVNQKKLPPEPPWAMAGGYELNDHTFPDWAAEIWWDRNAIGSDGQRGAYRYVRNGKRYTYDQWPTEDPDVFTDKPSSITLNPT
ncbi:MAG: hypothetical protein QOI61_1065 [Actinomycetota bacterium]